MDTGKIRLLATAKAYELINASETDEGVKYILEEAFKLYEDVKLGVKVGKDGTGLSSEHLPLSIYAQWSKSPDEEDLILICDGAGSSNCMGIVWNGIDPLAEALETAVPVLAH